MEEREPCISTCMDAEERRSNLEQFREWMGRAKARFASSSDMRTDLHLSATRDALAAEVGDRRQPDALIPDYEERVA